MSDVGALDLVGSEGVNGDDLNGTLRSLVTGRHFVVYKEVIMIKLLSDYTKRALTHLDNGSDTGDISVLLVHVVSTGTAVVSEEDTEVLDLERVLLRQLKKIRYL